MLRRKLSLDHGAELSSGDGDGLSGEGVGDGLAYGNVGAGEVIPCDIPVQYSEFNEAIPVNV